jgi:hypothetical protein
MKPDLLTNATVVDDAIRFVSSSSQAEDQKSAKPKNIVDDTVATTSADFNKTSNRVF